MICAVVSYYYNYTSVHQTLLFVGKSGSDILESSKATDRGVTLELLAPVIPLIASKWAGIAKALDLCDYLSIFKDLSDMAKVYITYVV